MFSLMKIIWDDTSRRINDVASLPPSPPPTDPNITMLSREALKKDLATVINITCRPISYLAAYHLVRCCRASSRSTDVRVSLSEIKALAKFAFLTFTARALITRTESEAHAEWIRKQLNDFECFVGAMIIIYRTARRHSEF